MENISKDLQRFFGILSLQLSRNSGYKARVEIKAILDGIKGNPRRLEHFGFKVYSQSDEDGIIEEIFKRLNISRGIFCEIGVENGLECNSLYLLHKGWRGIWIDGNKNHQKFIETKFSSILKDKKLVLGIGYVHPDNINNLVSKKLLPVLSKTSEDIDFLSIDIDGMDIHIFDAMNFKPKVICIEYNSKFPANLSKKPVYRQDYSWNGTDYMGSSLLALKQVGELKGYTLVGTNISGVNAFFVRDDLVGDNFEVYDITEVYNPPRYYLYDDHFKRIGHSADFGDYVDMLNEQNAGIIFENIYKNKIWGGAAGSLTDQFYSGSGSRDDAIVNTYVNAVSEFLASFDVKPDVVDLGCGDFNVGKQLRHLCNGYIACDVVDSLVEFNKVSFDNLNVDFRCVNLSIDVIPKGDVVFIRQVLQHLSNEHILPIISKLVENFKYLILTEHLPINHNFPPNVNISTGGNIRLNLNSGVVLTAPPFNLPIKNERILCECAQYSGRIQTIIYSLQ
jgi:hypothetical protein